jgi:hypothetical protein
MTCFYVWTVFSGTGRYFLWGLLFVGPLVVMVAQRVRASRAMRNALLLGLLALQGWMLTMTFEPNVWGLLPWRQGPGVALEPTKLKDQPAAFLTIGSISFSVLVPHMHLQSRWANIAGQQEWVPGMAEHARIQALLATHLPKYVVVRATRLVMDGEQQPIPEARGIIARALASQQLIMAGQGCQFVRAGIAGLPYDVVTDKPVDNGFWFCPVTRAPVASVRTDLMAMVPDEIEAVFDQVERRCPKFFPPNQAKTRPTEEGFQRFYLYSDIALNIHLSSGVYFKHFRSLNPTILGPVDDVRRGDFTLDCAHIPGRYLPPWSRP